MTRSGRTGSSADTRAPRAGTQPGTPRPSAGDGTQPGTQRPSAGDGSPPAVSELMAVCLARLSAGGELGLDDLCAEHPDHADELRRRMQKLDDFGMLGGAARSDPETVGPFTVAGLLGQGGMGRVYLAQQSKPVRRLVALKLMHAGMDADRLLERFDIERQALAVLSHPGISQVLEAGATEDGRPWFAMEYVDGAPLTDYCDEHGLDLRARLALFLQVCDAVVHAHQNGIIHRDLKPTNVIVTEHLGRPQAKVIDFGLAKALGEADGDTPMLTRAGQVVGTPAYMSPEQAGVSGEVVDVRTDVYSLGVMLHELLVGRLPLEPGGGSGVMAEMRQLLQDVEPRRPSECVRDQPAEAARLRGITSRAWGPALAGDLDWIVARSMAKDRNERYATAAALADDIRRHLEHAPVLAGPASKAYRVRRFLRRYRREAAIAALGLLGLIVALVVISFQALELGDELDNFNLLARQLQLSELMRVGEDELWPESPALLGAMADWRREAAEILAEEADYERILATLRSRGQRGPNGWEFSEARDGYLHDHVEQLLQDVVTLRAEGGLLVAVDARADWASTLVQRTVDDHRAAWDAAIASIADREQCPRYEGLSIVPQPGLVPLGRDPVTTLWEFAMPRPGAALPRGEPGAWRVDGDTCLVFVLIPGGVLHQGAQDQDPRARGYLPEIARMEAGGRTIRLAPFLLSKYELTQGQWLRFTGVNPAYYDPTHPFVEGLAHPVEQVTWYDCERVLFRLGLQFPTGAQWEYAARACGPSPWWTGPAHVPPECCANLADLSCLAELGRSAGIDDFEEHYDDDRPVHAPVGSFRPNAFGLHDVLGNVWEWCRDPGFDYSDTLSRPGDGLQQPIDPWAGDPGTREMRGGSFLSTFVKSRSTFRFYLSMEGANNVFGVRPARRLETEPLR